MTSWCLENAHCTCKTVQQQCKWSRPSNAFVHSDDNQYGCSLSRPSWWCSLSFVQRPLTHHHKLYAFSSWSEKVQSVRPIPHLCPRITDMAPDLRHCHELAQMHDSIQRQGKESRCWICRCWTLYLPCTHGSRYSPVPSRSHPNWEYQRNIYNKSLGSDLHRCRAVYCWLVLLG